MKHERIIQIVIYDDDTHSTITKSHKIVINCTNAELCQTMRMMDLGLYQWLHSIYGDALHTMSWASGAFKMGDINAWYQVLVDGVSGVPYDHPDEVDEYFL